MEQNDIWKAKTFSEKRPFGRLRRRWKDIMLDLKEVGCVSMDWIDLVQDKDSWRALVKEVMNPCVP
jgi:hypothetical protein